MDATATSVIPPEVEADNQAVIDHLMTGKPIDPEVARRIHERAEKARLDILRKHGVLNIAVDLIREVRDAE